MLAIPGKLSFCVFASVLLATPLSAQQAFPLEAGEAYVHPHSGIVVPAVLGGIETRRGISYAPDSLDVAIAYDMQGFQDSLTVYVFRKTNGAVPIWFAQAQSAVENRDKFNGLTLAFAPQAFVPPGQQNASGLRATYGLKSGEYSSTGLAMFEVNGFYVKLRASSKTRSAPELHGWIDEVLASLELPQGNAPAAAAITDCKDRLRYRGRSKDVKSDAGASALSGLLGSLLSAAIAEDNGTDETSEEAAAQAPVIWCRDEQLDLARATYRANASDNSYLLALGDNGNGVTVGPDGLSGLLSGEGADDGAEPSVFSITLAMAARNISFVAQDRLPRPSRVLDLIEKNRAVGSTSTWGDDRSININAEAL